MSKYVENIEKWPIFFDFPNCLRLPISLMRNRGQEN